MFAYDPEEDKRCRIVAKLAQFIHTPLSRDVMLSFLEKFEADDWYFKQDGGTAGGVRTQHSF